MVTKAIEAVYQRTEVQLCIVHLVRASLNYVPWKLRKAVAADLRLIYRAATAAEAEQHLAELETNWRAYPSVSQVWRRNCGVAGSGLSANQADPGTTPTGRRESPVT